MKVIIEKRTELGRLLGSSFIVKFSDYDDGPPSRLQILEKRGAFGAFFLGHKEIAYSTDNLLTINLMKPEYLSLIERQLLNSDFSVVI